MTAVHGIIDLARKIVVTRWLRAPDTIELTLDARRNYGDELVRGRILYLPYLDFSTPLAFMIEAIERDKESAKDEITVHGRTLDGIALAGRLCYPPLGEAYDTQTAVPAETAMKHFVEVNAGPGADAARQVPGLVIATDAARGIDVTKAARYQFVLDIEKEIAFGADLGWKMIFLPDTLEHQFEIIEPVDRSAEVFLDFEFASIDSWEEVETQIESRTLVVVAGQGEGAAREIVTRPAVEPEGLERREIFQDARDVAVGETAVLEQRGDAVLAAMSPTRGITVVARQGGSFQYPTDYGLGDYVLARDAERELSEAKQVIGVRITVEQSAAVPTIEPILDKADPSTSPSVGSFSGGRADSSTGGGGGAPSGPAGGDLGGTYPDPTVNDDSHGHTSATVTTHSTGHAHGDLSGVGATDHHAAPVAGPDADVTVDAAGTAGTAGAFARSGHGHKVATTDAPSGADVTVDAAPSAAATGAIARATHGHRLNTSSATPTGPSAAGAAGASTTAPSRGDHTHPALGAGVKTAAGATASLSPGTAANLTITWATAWADTNYKVFAIAVVDDNGAANVNVAVRSKTTTTVVLRVKNLTEAAGSITPTVWVLGVAD